MTAVKDLPATFGQAALASLAEPPPYKVTGKGGKLLAVGEDEDCLPVYRAARNAILWTLDAFSPTYFMLASKGRVLP